MATNSLPEQARKGIDARSPEEGIHFAYGWAMAEARLATRPDPARSARASLAEIAAVLTYASDRQAAALAQTATEATR